MKAIVFYVAMTASTLLTAGCDETENIAGVPAKSEQQAKETKNIMRFTVQPKPDPSQYKGTY